MINRKVFNHSDLVKVENAPPLDVCCTHLLSHIVRAETREDFDNLTESLKGILDFLKEKTDQIFRKVN